MKVLRVLLLVLVSVAAWRPAAAQAPAASNFPGTPYRAWIGAEGQPLPFQNDAEVLDFLRTARVISEKEISSGVTIPHKLVLEKDGIRANAVFRHVDQTKSDMAFAGGTREINFRDSYLFEPAAYELAVLLGMDNVPPAVVRRLHGGDGSVQIWVEQANSEEKRVKLKLKDPDPVRWAHYVHSMHVFDALIYNTDRNQGNILTTPDWKLWLIDHTRAFRLYSDFPTSVKLTHCDRRLLQRLSSLDAGLVRERLQPYLRKREIEAVLKRRDHLVQYFRRLVAEKGEDQVLFDSVPVETKQP